MNRKLTRFLAVALMVIMIFSSVPINVFASNTETEPITDSSMPVSIEAENSFAQMLTESMTTSTIPENESYYFAGLYVDDNDLLTVNFTNDDDCTLVVSFYDEETEQMLHSEVFEVPAKAKYARFQIDRTKLPEYFVVRAFLLGDNNEALCSNFESRDYTKKAMDFKSKTPDDFDASKVVELENDDFFVLKDGVKRVQPTVFRNKLVSYDSQTNTYEFESVNSHITGLNVGDVFYYNNGDKNNIIVIKVKSITFSGDNATICAEDTDLEDVFSFIKIDDDLGTDDFEVDTSALGDGVTYLGKQETCANNSISANAASEEDEEDKDYEIEVDYGVDDDGYGYGTVDATATLFEIKDDEDKKLTGNATVNISGNLRAYYSDGYVDVSLVITPSVHFELHFNGAFSKSFSLGKIQGSSHGINFGVRPTLTLSSTVKIDFSADLYCALGAGYNSITGFKNLSQAPVFTPKLDIEGTVSVSLDFSPFMNFLSENIIDFSLSVPFTINITAKLDSLLASDRVDGGIMHECNFCLDGDIDGSISVSAAVSFGIKDDDLEKVNSVELMKEKSFYITPFFYSKDKDDFDFTKCPYKLHKVNFSVYNQRDKKPLEDVTVYLNGGLADNDGNGIYTNTVGYTDSSGKISAFFPAGETAVTFSKKDFLDAEKTVEVENTYTTAISESVYMKEHKLHKVTFNVNNNEGEVVKGAVISFDDAYTKDGYELESVTTDSSGKAVAYYYDGVYSPRFSAEKHKDYYGMFSVSGEDTVYNVELKKVPMYKVTFTVKDTDGNPVNNAKILLDGGVADNDGDGKYTDEFVYTNSSGQAVAKFEDGTYYVSATAEGYSDGESTLKVDGKETECEIEVSSFGLKTGDIIEFGSYPQTRVTDVELIAALDSQHKNWISYEYYSGTDKYSDKSEPGDWMKYADITYGEQKYRAVTFSKYRPIRSCSEPFEDSSPQRKNGYYTGSVYYFLYEPIEWRVLDPKEGLVMCETIIDAQPFNNTIYVKERPGSYHDVYYKDETMADQANDYSKCSLRDWLNDDFYNIAFNSSEKSEIAVYECVTEVYDDYGLGTKITYDKVFLLTYWDMLNEAYGFSSKRGIHSSRNALTTDYAICQGAEVSYDDSDEQGWWTLRTPHQYKAESCYVFLAAVVWNADVNRLGGIRPAMKINLSSFAQEEAAAVSYQVEDAEKSDNSAIDTTDIALNGASATTDGNCALVPDVKCIPGNEYIVLNVLDYSEEGFKLTRDNLLFINQFIADGYGDITQAVLPKTFNPASTVLVIGDFGKGIEVKTSSGAVTGVKVDDLALIYKSQTQLTPDISTTGSGNSVSSITYSSSDESVVTVDSDGNVTAKGTGQAQITVTITDEYGMEIKDTCTVTVSYTWWQWLINIFLLGFLWY
ncbi:MAG: hypothetical protein E7536_10645 [Ruminococcaceae bacterium]|nr:hypothetical protein [Oscillospiraceae bacterium]